MPSPQTVPDWRCHERFYFSDGSLHLLAEDSLYRVHRSLFEIHANKFPVRGIDASYGNPYTFKDVKQIDFDRLLACLYPNTLLVEEAKTSEEWMSILKLASKWGFESLRSRAIRKIKRTLNTPVDMVAFGRQYDIPDILLPGYATLCQTNVPLTYEEGLQLGMKDVVDIYRIRHELHGPDITTVSFEESTTKVKAFISNEGRTDDAGGETAECDAGLDDEEASDWSDVGSVSLSRATSAEDDREREAPISMADTDILPSEAAKIVDKEKLGGSGSEHCSPNTPSPKDTSGNQGGDTHPNMSGSTTQCPVAKLFDTITIDNFDVISNQFFQLVNVNDGQILYYMTKSIVEKAVRTHGQIDFCVHLCKEMVKNVSGQVQDVTKNPECKVVTGVSLFREYLGEVCQEKLESAAASVTSDVRRQRLIRFIGKVADFTPKVAITQGTVKKWITTLLDPEDEEKLVTLSMLLDSAGPRWDVQKKLKGRMNSCFVEMTNIAQKTNNARLRTLLEGVIERRNEGWVETPQQDRDIDWYLQTKRNWSTTVTGLVS